MTVQVLMGDRKELLPALKGTGKPFAVVGDTGISVSDGAVLVLDRSDRHSGMSPVLAPNRKAGDPQIGAMGVTTFDLDTVSAYVSILGQKPDSPQANGLFQMMDEAQQHGLHAISQSGNEDGRRMLYAVLAKQREIAATLRAGRQINEISEPLDRFWGGIQRIISGDNGLLSNGEALRQHISAINVTSFMTFSHGVITRAASEDVSEVDLYVTPSLPGESSRIARGMVNYITGERGQICISLSSRMDSSGVNCLEIARSQWGDQVFGSQRRAYSPNGQRMNTKDLFQVTDRFCKDLDSHPASHSGR